MAHRNLFGAFAVALFERIDVLPVVIVDLVVVLIDVAQLGRPTLITAEAEKSQPLQVRIDPFGHRQQVGVSGQLGFQNVQFRICAGHRRNVPVRSGALNSADSR